MPLNAVESKVDRLDAKVDGLGEGQAGTTSELRGPP
jgi:hypothetical protein